MTVKDIIHNGAGQPGCNTSTFSMYLLREEHGKLYSNFSEIYENKQERTAAPLGPQFGLAQRVRQVPCSRKHDDLPDLQHKIEIESCFNFFLEHCQWVCCRRAGDLCPVQTEAIRKEEVSPENVIAVSFAIVRDKASILKQSK